MYFFITYDWLALKGNVVGREGKSPVGYGPNGPRAVFTLDEVQSVADALEKQVGRVPTMHLHLSHY